MPIDSVNYNIRFALRNDSKRIWEIRNHPGTRRNSGNSEYIEFGSHDTWYEGKYFQGQQNFCFVLDAGGLVIGYCRFDFESDKERYIISIAIDPIHHTKGWGHMLLSESLKRFDAEKNVAAEVKKKNIASFNLFKKNSFKVKSENEDAYFMEYTN